MLTTTAIETATDYILTVTDGMNSFEYQWGKQLPQSQNLTNYLQSCKRESELLAQSEINKKETSTPIVI